MFDDNMHGVWIGQNAIIAITGKLQIVFLKTKDNVAISLFKHSEMGLISVTYAIKTDSVYDINVSMINSEKTSEYTSLKIREYMNKHKSDNINIIKNGEDVNLIYTMYDGSSYTCQLAERIKLGTCKNEINSDNLSVSQKLELWSMGSGFNFDNNEIQAGINTHKYSISYNTSIKQNIHYCRAGCNGYSDKGYALLPIFAIQTKKVTVADNLLDYLKVYKPIENCFVKNACAFPSDGGWYWSLKNEYEDKIVLNGCNKEEYCYIKGGECYEYILL